jgi:hypothetical protein
MKLRTAWVTKPRLANLVLALALATATSLSLGQVDAKAGTYLGSYVTPGCEQATVWKIGYRFYWRNDRGMTRPTSDILEAMESARLFADKVGQFSECGVRISFDFFDEGEAVFTGGYNVSSGWVQGDSEAFVDNRYDYAFYRAPDVATVSGVTNFRDAFFPISASEDASAPWWGLQMHEWLHGVVHFYSHIQQGWPFEDVHGGCQRPDYIARDPGYGCMVLPSWFADLMTGRVVENGLGKGILQPEWAYFGTPLNPLHVPAKGIVRQPSQQYRLEPILRLRRAKGRNGAVSVWLTAREVPTGRPAEISVLRQRRTCARRSTACRWHQVGRRRTWTLSLRPSQKIGVGSLRRGVRMVVSVMTQPFEINEYYFAKSSARIVIHG